MEIALILTVIFFISAIIGIVWVNKDNNRLMQYHISILEKSNKELHKQITDILDKQFKETIEKAKAQKQEPQGIAEASDDTYNQIIQEWIYGADTEDKEGGIDG